MSLQRQVLFWVGALLVVGLLFWVLRGVLLPFVAGMALAYLLDPVADRLERLGLSRMAATVFILMMFVAAFTLALVLLIPILGSQLASFIAHLPGYIIALQRLLSDLGGDVLSDYLGTGVEQLQASLSDLVSQGAQFAGNLVAGLWTGGQVVIGILSLLVVTPVVAFYLLADWDKMLAECDRWLPRKHAATLRMLAREIDEALSGFVRGQVAICLILGTFYAVGLTLVGLNSGLLIGLGAGLISFIPFVGTILGFVVSVGVALVQFWPDWLWIGAVVVIFLAGQFLEGNILQPKLVGSYVGLHPVWLMFALFAFGYLFGFVGLFLAVPLAAAVGVLARFALRQYMASALYTGNAPRETVPLEIPPATEPGASERSP